ncbi:tRNA-splicing endonuclease subunit Sen15 isoform X2 [Ictalurus furcatus]|uniref:tRNA-splicing endonuclease subunit Sen15 isoform X2 n=1 Tax=Ictalurus furcatus TaxID=66913 RepID=UPI002350A2B6|nr:tRNA-splicing endonuclease subunit Sen15 isoform X2 [Ictalurus furcatus]
MISACRHIEKHQHCCTTHELIRTLLLGNCVALPGSIPARHLFKPFRRWTGVVAVPSPELQVVLLEGREKEGGEVQVVYPLPAHRSVSHRDLRCIVGRGTRMLLCAVASDSTMVYQRLSDGLMTPDPPVDVRDLGRRQHRKRRLQT